MFLVARSEGTSGGPRGDLGGTSGGPRGDLGGTSGLSPLLLQIIQNIIFWVYIKFI
jgi:hypothetical protein